MVFSEFWGKYVLNVKPQIVFARAELTNRSVKMLQIFAKHSFQIWSIIFGRSTLTFNFHNSLILLQHILRP